MWTVVLVVMATFASAALSAVAGFGGATLLLPVFVAVFGVRDAVAILTVAQLASNASQCGSTAARSTGRLVGVFGAGAVPAAIVGSLSFATAPLPALTRVIGAFLLLMVFWRRMRPDAARLGDRAFAAVRTVHGRTIGSLTASRQRWHSLVPRAGRRLSRHRLAVVRHPHQGLGVVVGRCCRQVCRPSEIAALWWRC